MVTPGSSGANAVVTTPRTAGTRWGTNIDAGREPRRQLQTALHLRGVLMSGRAIRTHALLGRGERRRFARGAAGARQPGLAVHVDRAGLHQSRRQQRREAEDHRGREAARVRDQLRAGELIAEQLRQSVDGFAEPIGRRMLEPVPIRIRRCGQPEVAGQVDHAESGLEERRGQLRAGAVRQRAERDVGRPPRCRPTPSSRRTSSPPSSRARFGWTSPSVFPDGSVRTEERHARAAG